MRDEMPLGVPAPLPDYMEEHGVGPALDLVRDALRVGGAQIEGMTDVQLLAHAVDAEREAEDEPNDVMAALLVLLYRAVVVHRLLESKQSDRKGVFIRMARKAGFHYRFEEDE